MDKSVFLNKKSSPTVLHSGEIMGEPKEEWVGPGERGQLIYMNDSEVWQGVQALQKYPPSLRIRPKYK